MAVLGSPAPCGRLPVLSSVMSHPWAHLDDSSLRSGGPGGGRAGPHTAGWTVLLAALLQPGGLVGACQCHE